MIKTDKLPSKICWIGAEQINLKISYPGVKKMYQMGRLRYAWTHPRPEKIGILKEWSAQVTRRAPDILGYGETCWT